jgi:hypothetical protein
MKQPRRGTSGQHLVRLKSSLQRRLFFDFDEGVERAVARFCPFDGRFRQLQRADASLLDGCRRFLQ